MTIVRFDELQAVPWKNGLGITREIAVAPTGASMDAFLWRVSIADVDTASPFSRFPGIDRTIVLLEGDGFTMTLDGTRTHALTVPCEPFAFPGEASVAVALAGGATRDFNLMVRRGAATGAVEVLRGARAIDAAGAVLVHVAAGTGVIDGVTCTRGDSALRPGRIALDEGAVALVVRIA
ncbi:HutD family protein [Luteibacter sp. 329MFSha]|uniref:HutD/Ves family protein n=1 Tax=Luteibacter sp. 329MFSha TaxID=1798239 RepID=UPI0008CDADB9|nr:HutD family protein [Luteibacter sp. 329MFSha]SEW13039.1 hypothetical protein SAMN04515660_2399 [Luteibacter sp. 329MFSha]